MSENIETMFRFSEQNGLFSSLKRTSCRHSLTSKNKVYRRLRRRTTRSGWHWDSWHNKTSSPFWTSDGSWPTGASSFHAIEILHGDSNKLRSWFQTRSLSQLKFNVIGNELLTPYFPRRTTSNVSLHQRNPDSDLTDFLLYSKLT